MSTEPAELPLAWEVPSYSVSDFKPRRTRYAVGIPVIDEGERLHRQLGRMGAAQLFDVADVIIADGGSTDGSTDTDRLAAVGVRALLTKTGPGALGAQIRMFLAHGLGEGYDGFVLIDGNDKDGVEAIPDFVDALAEGWDYVQGSRYLPGGYDANTPLARKLGVRLLHAPLLSLASRTRYTDTTNGFRAISRRFLLDPRVEPFRDEFDTYALHYYLARQAGRLAFRVKELPVTRVYPSRGEVPTKIKGIRSYAHILALLFRTVTGGYDPPEPRGPTSSGDEGAS